MNLLARLFLLHLQAILNVFYNKIILKKKVVQKLKIF